MLILAEIIHRIFQLFVLLVVVKVLLSYFVPPYSQIRIFLDQIVEPVLEPIRRILPPMGMFDFSPMVLIIILILLDSILTGIIRSLAV
jgi:YggT family protein